MALIVGGTTVTGTQTLDATKLSGNLPNISGASLTNLPKQRPTISSGVQSIGANSTSTAVTAPSNGLAFAFFTNDSAGSGSQQRGAASDGGSVTLRNAHNDSAFNAFWFKLDYS